MIRGLVEKELRQHGMSLAFLLIVFLGSTALLNTNRNVASLTGSPLESLHIVLIFLLPLAGAFLGQVLIASEFRHKTQLFLEGLPLPRWWMLAVKYAFGLLVLLLGASMTSVIAWKRAHGVDALTPHFATIVALKSIAWIWFIYSVFFAHGFLGRYRVITALGGLIGLIALQSHGVPVGEFPAFRLMDQRFAYERINIPALDLWITSGMALLFTVGGFAMGLMRDATIASMLAERMSSRERLILTFAGIAALVSFSYITEQKDAAAPVVIPGSFDVERGLVRVSASAAVDSPLSGETAALKRIAGSVADDLDAMATYLGCTHMPPVFIVHRRDLSASQLENGELKPKQGLMVRTNLMAPGFDEDALKAWIIREILLLKSSERAGLERNAWVLDGFPRWWRQTRGAQPKSGENPLEFQKPTAAMPKDFTAKTLERWLLVQQQVGKDKATNLASTGLAFLAEKHGSEACRGFLASMLAQDVPPDARGWFRDVVNTMPHRFRKSASISLDAFVSEWKASMESSSANKQAAR